VKKKEEFARVRENGSYPFPILFYSSLNSPKGKKGGGKEGEKKRRRKENRDRKPYLELKRGTMGVVSGLPTPFPSSSPPTGLHSSPFKRMRRKKGERVGRRQKGYSSCRDTFSQHNTYYY